VRWSGAVYSLYASGNDVYVAGYIGDTAKVWKNGVVTNLFEPNRSTQANAVFVSGTDVYVAGVSTSRLTDKVWTSFPRLWKNGVSIKLDLNPNYSAEANGVCVNGSDVYVSGNVSFASPVIWKNGVKYNVGSGSFSSKCYGIVVKKK
jgi:hypothetical protein